MKETRPSGVVSLLSDFGLADPFVGVLKGVMLREAREVSLVDLTHGVPPQDYELAGFLLAGSFRAFPAGTVHLAVVDPGVGSERAAIAVRASGHFFVAPDNGLLSRVLAADPQHETRAIDVERLGLGAASRTFHGRDVFAPMAARLASGHTRFENVGALYFARFLPSAPAGAGGEGLVLFVDHFGNLISDVPGAFVRDLRDPVVEVMGRRLRVVGTYAEAEPGECVGLVSSFETLEVAMREGNAAQALGIGRGARLSVVEGAAK